MKAAGSHEPQHLATEGQAFAMPAPSTNLRMVAVLFARADSIYKTMPGCDVWDEARDARTWPGGSPVVAHPPCRLWASLRTKSKAPPEEKDHARWAMAQVRANGGVLEHPWLSTLWDEYGIRQSRCDSFGWLLPVDLFAFGFQAKKRTGLYVVSCEPHKAPAIPLRLGEATHTVGLWSGRDKATCRPSIAKRQYDSTPPEMAAWLVELARRTSVLQAAA